jgi:hypothetical protein
MEHNIALLPVGKCFHNKRNLTIDEIAEIWGDGNGCTVQVMDRSRGANKNTTTVFVVGSGHNGGYSPHLTAKHDQNGSYLGEYKQFGEIRIDNGNVVAKMVVKGRKIPNAAPVQVYK